MDIKENDKFNKVPENTAINTEGMEIESCIAKGSDCEVMKLENKKADDITEQQDTLNFEESNKILLETKSLEADISNDETVAEMSLITTNSIEPTGIITSEGSLTSSNVGCINGDSGISLEKFENSSEKNSSTSECVNKNVSANENINSEHSEANVECDNISTTSNPMFHKLKSKVKERNYRTQKNVADTWDNSNDMIVDDSIFNFSAIAQISNAEQNNSSSSNGAGRNCEGRLETNSNGSDQEEEEDEINEWTTASEDESEEENIPIYLKKEPAKPNFFIVPDLIRREMGINQLLHRRYYGSLHVVQRLELMYKLCDHQGCVNTLHFNEKGNLLASGSDDFTIVIWDWAIGKKHLHFDSGHRNNLFQVKWLPLDGEYLMATCARDGQVRLLDLRRSSSRKLVCHFGPCHKLATHQDLPHVILSVGQDAKVYSLDIRETKPNKLVVVQDGSRGVHLYTIHCNPLNSNEFCVGGNSPLIKVYDRRKVSTPLYNLCPDHLAGNKYVHITSAVYNYNGTEILGSYNDEAIYLFDTATPKPGEFAHQYQGHRNNATIKGVSFFGPKSEFILSGSDCGNIFIWDKNTEAIVQWMQGDEQGVVNHLEPHPHIPILATSGLDHDVKIWIPSCEESPKMTNLDECVRYNLRCREMGNDNKLDTLDRQRFMFVLNHIRYMDRLERINIRPSSRQTNDSDTS